MPLPAKLQHKTYSTDVAATSHALTLDAATRTPAGANAPTSLILVIGYDGSGTDKVTSVTVSGEAAMVKNRSQAHTANLEVWSVHNLTGGTPSTVTVTLSTAQKVSMVVAEVTEIRPYGGDPIDQVASRVHAPGASQARRDSGLTAKRSGMIEVIVGGMAWADATKTAAAFLGWGSLATILDASSGIGVAFSMRSTELVTIDATDARFNLTPASVVPAAVACCTYQRLGVLTSSDEDGYIDTIADVTTVYTTTQDLDFLYASSESAPVPEIIDSEFSDVFAFMIWPTLPAGVTVASGTWNCLVVSAFWDGVDWGIGFRGSPTGAGGATLEEGDRVSVAFVDDPVIDYLVWDNEEPLAGTKSQPFPLRAIDQDPGGNVNIRLIAVPFGDRTLSHVYLSTYSRLSGASPQYLLLALTWPIPALDRVEMKGILDAHDVGVLEPEEMKGIVGPAAATGRLRDSVACAGVIGAAASGRFEEVDAKGLIGVAGRGVVIFEEP